MIRRIKLRMETEAAEALVQLADHVGYETWPDEWGELGGLALELAHPLREAYEELVKLAEILARWELIEVAWLPSGEEPILAPLEIQVDLKLLLDDEDGEEAGSLFLGILDELPYLEGCDIRCWMGGRRSSYTDARAELLAQAEAYDYDLPGFYEGAVVDDEDEWEEAEEAEAEPEEEESRAKKNRGSRSSQGKQGRRWNNARSWGGLDDDEIPHHQSWKHSLAQLSENAQFFLSYTSLTWPCSAVELNQAWHKALHNSHPDKFPNDPSANTRTQMINMGYQELKSIVQHSTP